MPEIRRNKLLSMFVTVILIVFLCSFCSLADEIQPKKLTNSEGFVYTLNEDGTAEITGYTGKEKKLSVPAQLDGHTITSIGEKAFQHQKALEEITIPETVKAIHSNAFSHCDSLTALNLPDTIETIDNSAFGFCSKLSEVNIPDSVISFGKSVFHGCTGLKKVIVSENQPILKTKDGILFSKDELTLIWYSATRKDASFSIPKGTKEIRKGAFSYAKAKKIIIPDTVDTIEPSSFVSCPQLTEVNIPPLVTKLDSAFPGCDRLARINVDKGNTIYYSEDGVLFSKPENALVIYPSGRKETKYTVPDGIEIIMRNAFENAHLKEIQLSSTLRIIQSNAFARTDKLIKIELPEGVQELGSDCFVSSSLTEINIPDSVTEMTKTLFRYCDKLKTIQVSENHPLLAIMDKALVNKNTMTLFWYPLPEKTASYQVPAGIKIIGFGAFENNNNLKEVILSEGVEEIKSRAFVRCSNLTKVVLPESLKQIDKDAFSNEKGGLIDATYVVVKGSYSENFFKEYGATIEYQ